MTQEQAITLRYLEQKHERAWRRGHQTFSYPDIRQLQELYLVRWLEKKGLRSDDLFDLKVA